MTPLVVESVARPPPTQVASVEAELRTANAAIAASWTGLAAEACVLTRTRNEAKRELASLLLLDLGKFLPSFSFEHF